MPQNNVNENQGANDQKRQHDVPMQPQSSNNSKKSNRGFASMDAAKQREIASKGGRAAHQKGTAHQFTPEEARQAGRKGGGTVSQDRAHMAEIGRIGGQSRGRRLQGGKATPSEPPSSANVSGEDSPSSESEGEEADTGANPDYRH